MKKPPECNQYECKASGLHGEPKMCETHDNARERRARHLSPDMLRCLFEIGQRSVQFDAHHSGTINALRARGLILYPVESEWCGALTEAGKRALDSFPKEGRTDG